MRFPAVVGQLPQLTYGRLKPMVLTTAVLGWLTLAGIGAVYYLLPRLTGAPMWGERIARLNLMAAVPIYAAASLAPVLGLSSGQELLEVPWYLDLLILATLAVPLGVTIQTLRRRTEEGLYVSLWYVVAGVTAAFGLWLVGNLPGVIGDLPGLGGITTALQRVIFSSGFLTLWVVGIGIGAAYYLLPKETGNPLFSRGLAAAGFWSVVLAALWAAPTALTHTPVPGWAQTVAAVMALGLVIPALAVATNFAGTLHGRWDTFTTLAPCPVCRRRNLLPRTGDAGLGGQGVPIGIDGARVHPHRGRSTDGHHLRGGRALLRRLHLSRHPPDRRAARVQRLLRAAPPANGVAG